MTRETCVFRDPRQRERCTECGHGLDLCVCEDPDERSHQRLTSDEGQFLAAVHAASQEPRERDHIFERIVCRLGVIGLKLAHNENGETPDSEIRLELMKLATDVTVLAVSGTPEYPYPTT